MHASLKVTAKNSAHAGTAYLCPHKAYLCLLVFVSFKRTLIGIVLSGSFSNAKTVAWHNAACLQRSGTHWSLLVCRSRIAVWKIALLNVCVVEP